MAPRGGGARPAFTGAVCEREQTLQSFCCFDNGPREGEGCIVKQDSRALTYTRILRTGAPTCSHAHTARAKTHLLTAQHARTRAPVRSQALVAPSPELVLVRVLCGHAASAYRGAASCGTSTAFPFNDFHLGFLALVCVEKQAPSLSCLSI